MPAPSPRERAKPLLAILGFGLLYLLGNLLCAFPLSGIQETLGRRFEDGILFTALAGVGGACLATDLCLSLDGQGLKALDPLLRTPGRWLKAAGGGCLAGLALAAAVGLLMALAGCLSNPRLMLSPRSLLEALGGFVSFALVAVHEEALFRGYPLRRLEAVLGPWPALVLLGALFGLAHLRNPGIAQAPGAIRGTAILNITLIGVLFGHLALRTRSLAVPMGLHLGWNWAQGNLLGFGVSGLQVQGLLSFQSSSAHPWLTGGAVGLEGSGLGLGVLLAFAGILAFRNPWKPWKPAPSLPGEPEPRP